MTSSIVARDTHYVGSETADFSTSSQDGENRDIASKIMDIIASNPIPKNIVQGTTRALIPASSSSALKISIPTNREPDIELLNTGEKVQEIEGKKNGNKKDRKVFLFSNKHIYNSQANIPLETFFRFSGTAEDLRRPRVAEQMLNGNLNRDFKAPLGYSIIKKLINQELGRDEEYPVSHFVVQKFLGCSDPSFFSVCADHAWNINLKLPLEQPVRIDRNGYPRGYYCSERWVINYAKKVPCQKEVSFADRFNYLAGKRWDQPIKTDSDGYPSDSEYSQIPAKIKINYRRSQEHPGTVNSLSDDISERDFSIYLGRKPTVKELADCNKNALFNRPVQEVPEIDESSDLEIDQLDFGHPVSEPKEPPLADLKINEDDSEMAQYFPC